MLQAVSLINQLDDTKFSALLARILQKLHLKVTSHPLFAFPSLCTRSHGSTARIHWQPCSSASCSARADGKFPRQFCNVHSTPSGLPVLGTYNCELVLNMPTEQCTQIWCPVNTAYTSLRHNLAESERYGPFQSTPSDGTKHVMCQRCVMMRCTRHFNWLTGTVAFAVCQVMPERRIGWFHVTYLWLEVSPDVMLMNFCLVSFCAWRQCFPAWSSSYVLWLTASSGVVGDTKEHHLGFDFGHCENKSEV